ncbi:Uncharacterised protein [Corynebacterium kutscheri]|uniref:hypothetical protein n=1 Tax=Corynebacterium kutscheri TaxID=35755 RepID=UPI000F6C65ED|nr:hypothetical protein [Corynebacterium kutscheri]VEH81713.1 Uncharacterised protein [Corynebacterium kutscheri]
MERVLVSSIALGLIAASLRVFIAFTAQAGSSFPFLPVLLYQGFVSLAVILWAITISRWLYRTLRRIFLRRPGVYGVVAGLSILGCCVFALATLVWLFSTDSHTSSIFDSAPWLTAIAVASGWAGFICFVVFSDVLVPQSELLFFGVLIIESALRARSLQLRPYFVLFSDDAHFATSLKN